MSYHWFEKLIGVVALWVLVMIGAYMTVALIDPTWFQHGHG